MSDVLSLSEQRYTETLHEVLQHRQSYLACYKAYIASIDKLKQAESELRDLQEICHMDVHKARLITECLANEDLHGDGPDQGDDAPMAH